MRQFAVEVFQAHAADDALEILRREKIDLVLVNRKLDMDYSDGVEIIRQIKNDPALSSTPVMLVSNHDEYQQEALAAGPSTGSAN